MLWRHNRVRIDWYKHGKLTNHSARKTQLILKIELLKYL